MTIITRDNLAVASPGTVHPDDYPPVLPDNTDRPAYPDALPAWVEGLRDHQVDAVREIMDCYADGAEVVFLDAPVGAGKTLIAELVRRELALRGQCDSGLYVCSDKALQQQFLADFPYAKVLMGRGNYPTMTNATRTAEDCTFEGGEGSGGSCLWCDPVMECPYRVAKHAALGAKVATLNTAYMLAAQNHARTFTGRDLVVVDEADLLEDALLGFTSFEVGWWVGKTLGLDYPGKSVRKPTLAAWLDDAAQTAREKVRERVDQIDVKDRKKLVSFAAECHLVAQALRREVAAREAAGDGDDAGDDASGQWLRDYDTRTLKLLPVLVSRYGAKTIWRHSRRWLLMSGTIISADEMVDSLGVPLEHATVSIGSPFPVENRRVILAPVANVTARAEEVEYRRLAYAIEQIVERHPGRVLVHTVSYKLARRLIEEVDLGGRNVVTYDQSRGKDAAMRDYLRIGGSVMFAPSMDRGVDLAGDRCEAQIIAKAPFPYLGDKRTAARMHLPGGQRWYATKAIRDVVQMTGRGVRGPDDVCPTYVLDQQFARNLWGRNKALFPAYFREAVDARADVRWLIGPE